MARNIKARLTIGSEGPDEPFNSASLPFLCHVWGGGSAQIQDGGWCRAYYGNQAQGVINTDHLNFPISEYTFNSNASRPGSPTCYFFERADGRAVETKAESTITCSVSWDVTVRHTPTGEMRSLSLFVVSSPSSIE